MNFGNGNQGLFPVGTVITIPTVLNKVNELLNSDSKNTFQPERNIEKLSILKDIASNGLGDPLLCKVLMAIISTHIKCFSLNRKLETWMNLLNHTVELMEILHRNKEFITIGDGVTSDKLTKNSGEMRGSISGLVAGVDNLSVDLLHDAEPFTTFYQQRLADERIIVGILESARSYLVSTSRRRNDAVVDINLRLIKHVYAMDDTTKELMADLCNSICVVNSNKNVKLHAILCQAYHLIILEDYEKGRKVLNKAKFFSADMTIENKILRCRTNARLAILAFSKGFVAESFEHLEYLYKKQCPDIFIAQDISFSQYKQHPQPSEWEKNRWKLQTLFHLQINLTLLRGVFLIDSLLLEMPVHAYLSATPYRYHDRAKVNKTFYEVFERKCRLDPGSIDEYIWKASQDMKNGECSLKNIINDRMKSIFWSHFGNKDVQNVISRNIKEQTLKTHLISQQNNCNTEPFHLHDLEEKFSLNSDLSQMIQTMISNREIKGILEEERLKLFPSQYFPNDNDLLTLLHNCNLKEIVSKACFITESDVEKFATIKVESDFPGATVIIQVGDTVQRLYYQFVDTTGRTRQLPGQNFDYNLHLLSVKDFGAELFRRQDMKLKDGKFIGQLWNIYSHAWQEFTKNRPSYGCVVVYNAAEVLMVSNLYHNWGFPKGKSHLGESDLGAAKRELTEETGLEGADVSLEKPFCHDKTTLFLAKVMTKSSELRADPTEITGVK